LSDVTPVEHRILSFRSLIAARCDEEVLIDPGDLTVLWPGVRQSLYDTVLNARVKVQELTTLADNTESFTVRVPSHTSGKIGQRLKEHS